MLLRNVCFTELSFRIDCRFLIGYPIININIKTMLTFYKFYYSTHNNSTDVTIIKKSVIL